MRIISCKQLLRVGLRLSIMKNFLALLFLSSCLWSCSKSDPPAQRTFRMGFAISGPRPDFSVIMQALDIWSKRADAAIISNQVPWDSLYSGRSPQAYVQNNYVGLANYYRSKGFKLWVYIDPANGLNRSADADDLAALGKSIADADAQKIYRRFVVVVDSMLKPDHLGLALETNLIRHASSSAIYNGVKAAVNGAAADVRTIDKTVKLSVSIQADEGWGKLTNTGYSGIEQDFTDFPFIEELGISSYPYFIFKSPDDMPTDYYSKLVAGKNIPVFISEGGWSSQAASYNGTTTYGDPVSQQKYIDFQANRLNELNAIAYFQLTFTDIDVASVTPPAPTLNYFAFIGLVDDQLQSKPALSNWDAQFKKPLTAGH